MIFCSSEGCVFCKDQVKDVKLYSRAVDDFIHLDCLEIVLNDILSTSIPFETVFAIGEEFQDQLSSEGKRNLVLAKAAHNLSS